MIFELSQEASKMKCPKCKTKLTENATTCRECGYRFGSAEDSWYHPENSQISDQKELSGSGDAESLLKPLSGFRRTLSTELVERQAKLRISVELNRLVERQIYKPGEVLIHKGDASRDLFFLTEGMVEISTKNEDGNLILNEIGPPYILGDIAFLSGFHRTATAKAKTKVEIFILRYDKLKNLSQEFPDWLNSLLTSFAGDIKSLHFRIAELEREIRNP